MRRKHFTEPLSYPIVTKMIGRIISLTLSTGYVLLAYIELDGEAAFKVSLFLLLPLACIWFGDEMGSFTGVMRGQYINTATPGYFVALGGWLLLVLPFITWVVMMVRT